MTNLTEQWKARELKEFYGKPFYIKKQNGVVKVDYLCQYGFLNNYDVVEVLAPCDYEEWQQLKEYERVVTSYNMKPMDYEIACETVNKLLDEKKGLRQENTQLKELLKEWCKFYPIVLYEYEDTLKTKDIVELYEKTNSALGED